MKHFDKYIIFKKKFISKYLYFKIIKINGKRAKQQIHRYSIFFNFEENKNKLGDSVKIAVNYKISIEYL